MGMYNHKYQSNADVAMTTAFVLVEFNFRSEGMIIANDEAAPSVKTVSISYDGVTTAAVIGVGEILTMDRNHHNRIYLKGSAGGEAYRLIVWS